MATRGPAGADAHEPGVIDVANIDIPRSAGGRTSNLRMAAEAEIGIANGEQLVIDGTVRIVARRAAFAHGGMFKGEGASLLLMALRAIFILARHRQSAVRFHDVHAVWVVALDAIHLSFEHGMVLREMKLSLRLEMAIQAGLGFLAGIDDEAPASAARRDVLASWTVARFTAAPAFHVAPVGMQPPVRAHGENTIDLVVAIRAGLVADVGRSFNRQRRNDPALRRAGVDQQKQSPHTRAQDREKEEAPGWFF